MRKEIRGAREGRGGVNMSENYQFSHVLYIKRRFTVESEGQGEGGLSRTKIFTTI